MRIYLDTCSLNRPLDDQRQTRIALESEAILAILRLCEQGIHQLLASDILVYEIARNPHPQRRALTQEIIAGAHEFILVDEAMRHRANAFAKDGIHALDALHLACAEAAQVDYFCTSDDRFYRRARSRADLQIRVVTPLELIQEVLP